MSIAILRRFVNANYSLKKVNQRIERWNNPNKYTEPSVIYMFFIVIDLSLDAGLVKVRVRETKEFVPKKKRLHFPSSLFLFYT